jgi:hypothetical protein
MATKSFQRDAGLPVTGDLDDRTLDALQRAAGV